MKITAQQYISNSKESNSYVTVFRHYYNSSTRKVAKEGDLYALISISSKKKIKAERISKFVWDSIVDGYLYSSSTTTNESLRESIGKGVAKVKDLMTNNKELEETGIDVSFTIVLARQEGIYVGIFGENDVYTFKKGSFVNVGDILSKKQAKTAGIPLEKNDLLMVSSSGLLEKNSTILSTLKKKEIFLRELNSIGDNIVGSNVLLYFSLQEEKKTTLHSMPVRERIIPLKAEKKDMEIKKDREEIIQPKKITGQKVQLLLMNIKEKVKPKERIAKAKLIMSATVSKTKEIAEKLFLYTKQKGQRIGEVLRAKVEKKRWFKKIAAKYSQQMLGRRKPVGVKGMRIDSYKIKNLRGKRFKLLFVILLTLVLFALGINSTIKMKEARERTKIAREKFEEIEEVLKKCDNSFSTDRASAEMYLYQAEKLLLEIPTSLKEKEQMKYDEIEERIVETGDTLYKRIGFVEKDSRFNKLVDTRLGFGEGAEAIDMAYYRDSLGNEFLMVADKGRKAVHRVSLYDNTVKTLPDNNGLIKEPKYIYMGNAGVYIFDEKEGMLKSTFDGEGWYKPFEKLSGLGTRDVKADDISDMTIWGELNDNVFFLSKDRKAILKSSLLSESRYGLAYSYIENEEFENANAMASDLSVYVVISEAPHLLRYNYSFWENAFYEAPVGYLGFDGNFSNLTKISTEDTLDNPLYLYDSGAKEFFKFEKPIEGGLDTRHPDELSLINRYVYRGEKSSTLKNVYDFMVDKEEANMYILDDSVIWKLSL